MNEISFVLNQNKLYLETVLAELDFPVLYTCIDDNCDKYLTMCIDAESLEYIIAKTNKITLYQMIEGVVPMYRLFKESRQLWKIKMGDNYLNDEIKMIEFSDLKEDELPDKNSYYKIPNENIKKYAEQLLKRKYQITFNKVNIVSKSILEKTFIKPHDLDYDYSHKFTFYIFSSFSYDGSINLLKTFSNTIQYENEETNICNSYENKRSLFTWNSISKNIEYLN